MSEVHTQTNGDAEKPSPPTEKEIFRRFLGEFDHASLRWVKWLLSKGDRWPVAPGILLLALAGVVAGVLAWLAGTCGFALVFRYALAPESGTAPVVVTYTHVMGYLGEANFAIWLILGFPLFVWLALNLLHRTARGFEKMKDKIEARPNAKGARFFPRWTGSPILGWFWVLASVAVWMASFCVQIRESHRAKNPPWLVADPQAPGGPPKVLVSEFQNPDHGFDFGNTWAPYLQRSVVEPFNGLPLKDKLEILLHCRPQALVAPWVCYHQQFGALVSDAPSPTAEEVERQLGDKLQGGSEALTIWVHPQSARLQPVDGAMYWLFVFLAYGLTGLGWVAVLWVLFKVGLVLWVIWLTLRAKPDGVYLLKPKLEERFLGLKPLFYGTTSLLYLGIFGAAYITLMRSVPMSYADRLDGSIQFLAEPQTGFSPQSLKIDEALAFLYLGLVAIGLLGWYFAASRLRKDPPGKTEDYNPDEHETPALQTWGNLLLIVVAITLPFSSYFSNSVAQKVLKLPLAAKHLASMVFGLPEHGARGMKPGPPA